jgi:cyclopropane-fatty-acyl-phospholipid synthase
MFEAVGFERYDEFFRACDRLLKPDGSMLLQTITMNEQKFPQYVKQSDWIQKYIFPAFNWLCCRESSTR